MRFRVNATHSEACSMYEVIDTQENKIVRVFTTETHMIPEHISSALASALNNNPNHLEGK